MKKTFVWKITLPSVQISFKSVKIIHFFEKNV